MPATSTDWTTYLQTGGTVGLLTIAVVAFSRDWVVTRGTHQAALEERDAVIAAAVEDRNYYREALFTALGVTKRQVSASERLTNALLERNEQEDRLQERINILTQKRGGGDDQREREGPD